MTAVRIPRNRKSEFNKLVFCNVNNNYITFYSKENCFETYIPNVYWLVKKMPYKWCVVANCSNNSNRTPKKLFLSVPKNIVMRQKWLLLGGRNPRELEPTSSIYMCEDHFELEMDVANYNQYRMGFSTRLLLAKRALPSKLYRKWLEKNIFKKACTSLFYFPNRQRMALNQDQDMNMHLIVTSGPIGRMDKKNKSFSKLAVETTSIVGEQEADELDIETGICGQSGRLDENYESSSELAVENTDIVGEPSMLESDELVMETSICGPDPSDSDDTLSVEDAIIKEECEESHDEWTRNDEILIEDDPIEDTRIKLELEESHGEWAGNDEVPAGDPHAKEYLPQKHAEFSCASCKGDIIGYTCVQCESYDLCRACEGRLVHPQHYMLRVPAPRPYTEVKNAIAAIRAKIYMLEDALKQSSAIWCDEVEIKKEVDPLPFEVERDVDLRTEDEKDPFEETTVPNTDVGNRQETAEQVKSETDDCDDMTLITTYVHGTKCRSKTERVVSNIGKMNVDKNKWNENS